MPCGIFITHICSKNISEILDDVCLKPVVLQPGTFYFLAFLPLAWLGEGSALPGIEAVVLPHLHASRQHVQRSREAPIQFFPKPHNNLLTALLKKLGILTGSTTV